MMSTTTLIMTLHDNDKVMIFLLTLVIDKETLYLTSKYSTSSNEDLPSVVSQMRRFIYRQINSIDIWGGKFAEFSTEIDVKSRRYDANIRQLRRQL